MCTEVGRGGGWRDAPGPGSSLTVCTEVGVEGGGGGGVMLWGLALRSLCALRWGGEGGGGRGGGGVLRSLVG